MPGNCNPPRLCYPGSKQCNRENVALRRLTNMSSVYTAPCRAVDGIIPSSPDEFCSSAESRSGDYNAWWYVDLGQNYTITNITIFRQFLWSIRMADVHVKVDGQLCYTFPTHAEGEKLNKLPVRLDIQCVPPLTGRVVSLQKVSTDPSSTYLTYIISVCEVQVWGCGSGYYGADCGPCGHCAGDGTCNIVTGVCPSGCLAGWQGPQCLQPCDNGTYGDECKTKCGHCRDNYCDKASGRCPSDVCQNRWQPPFCQTCAAGYYGESCTACGNCTDSTTCNSITGRCPSGCKAGWQGERCLQPCNSGTYGPDCTNQCGHCIDGSSCNMVTGQCPRGCQAGWTGPRCDQPCTSGTYGLNCTQQCGQCIEGSTCNVVTGDCPRGCKAGWFEQRCDKLCTSGTYGLNCLQQCGQCTEGSTCRAVTGECPHGCQAGWYEQRCDKPCEDGTYGPDCANQCGQCAGGSTCSKTYGDCPPGCQEGWNGTRCDQNIGVPTRGDKDASLVAPTAAVGPVVGAIIGGFVMGVILAVPLTLCVIRHRSRRSASTQQPLSQDVRLSTHSHNQNHAAPTHSSSVSQHLASTYEDVGERQNTYDSLQREDQRPDEKSVYTNPVFRTDGGQADKVYYENTDRDMRLTLEGTGPDENNYNT